MYSYYCLYNHYQERPETGVGELGHLLIINVGTRDCQARIDIFYEDGVRDTVFMDTQVRQTTESNWESWGKTRKNVPFAYVVSCDEPLICHVTIGWNNTLNDYSLALNEHNFKVAKRPDYRESVTAYSAIRALSREWFHPDGIQIEWKDSCWVYEKEWVILFNPGEEEALASFHAVYKNNAGERVTDIVLPPHSLKTISCLELIEPCRSYAAIVSSDKPIAAQWLRTINWYDRSELMSYWTIPMQQI